MQNTMTTVKETVKYISVQDLGTTLIQLKAKHNRYIVKNTGPWIEKWENIITRERLVLVYTKKGQLQHSFI